MTFDPDSKPKTIKDISELKDYRIEGIVPFKENVQKVYASLKNGEGSKLEIFYQKINV